MFLSKKNSVILGVLTLLSAGQSLYAMELPGIVSRVSAFLHAAANVQQQPVHAQPTPGIAQEVQAQQESFVEVPQEDFEAAFGDISFLPASDQQHITTNQIGAREHFDCFLKNFSWGLGKTAASACMSAMLGGFVFSRWHHLNTTTKLLGLMGSCGTAWQAYQRGSRLLADAHDARTNFLRIIFGADRNGALVARRDATLAAQRAQLVAARDVVQQVRTDIESVGQQLEVALDMADRARAESLRLQQGFGVALFHYVAQYRDWCEHVLHAQAAGDARKYTHQQEMYGRMLREKDKAVLALIDRLLSLIQPHLDVLENARDFDAISLVYGAQEGVQTREETLAKLRECKNILTAFKASFEIPLCVLCREPAGDHLGALVSLPCAQKHGMVIHQSCLSGSVDEQGARTPGLLDTPGVTCPLCRGALAGAAPAPEDEDVVQVLAEDE
ncbi:hypothetical protein CVU75_03690, partial [Candidatus Dependentiae bacterium HGW-Dependentiae-1]